MDLEITITADHIRDGIRGDTERCPVALALTEVIADTLLPSVLPGRILIFKKADRNLDSHRQAQYTCAGGLCNWITEFDQRVTGLNLEPIEVVLDGDRELAYIR